MAHGDAREGKCRGNLRMEWVASTLHTTSEHGVSSITTADAHTSTASSRLNWRPRRFKWTGPFRWKTKSGFCACAITFETQSTCSNVSVTRAASIFRMTIRYMWVFSRESDSVTLYKGYSVKVRCACNTYCCGHFEMLYFGIASRPHNAPRLLQWCTTARKFYIFLTQYISVFGTIQ